MLKFGSALREMALKLTEKLEGEAVGVEEEIRRKIRVLSNLPRKER